MTMLRRTLLMAAIAGTFLTTCRLAAAKPAENVSVKVTEDIEAIESPKFVARAVQDGELLSNDKLAGKGYIVNFFGSWCPYCRREIPEMVSLQEKYRRKGFTFIGAAYKDNEKTMPDFIWEHSINYPVIMADQTIIETFSRYLPDKLSSVPLLFAVGRDGRLLSVVYGVQSKEAFEKLILKTLQQ